MQASLKGQRKLPGKLPGSYTSGSKEEALCYADVLMAAWKVYPEAVAWLTRQSISALKAMDSLDGRRTRRNN